jgi:hypothetical protein
LAFAWVKEAGSIKASKSFVLKTQGVLMSRWLILTALAILSLGFVFTAHARDRVPLPGPANLAAAGQRVQVPLRIAAKKRGVGTRRTAPEASDTPAGKAMSNGEVLFGSQTVNFLVDRDIIRVGPEMGKFDRLRFRVLGNDIYVSSLDVIYDNDERETLLTNTRVNRNRKTSWMELRPGSFIKEVRLVYRAKPNLNRTARVEVFGEYSDGWLGPDGEARKYNDGWVLLGTDTAGMVGYDKVTIAVGKNDGGYKKLRVSVKDRDITLRYLTVIYADGEKDEIANRRRRVNADSDFGPLELKKEDVIAEIRGGWRSRAFSTSKRRRAYATVQVWGKH